MREPGMHERMLAVAIEEARRGWRRAGFRLARRIFTRTGELVSRGVTGAFSRAIPASMARPMLSRAGRQRSYRDLVMVTTLAPCWYCSGLVRQFRIGPLWWWARAGHSQAASTGCANAAWR